MQLRPYQTEGITAIRKALDNGINRQLVVWATGLGKTVLFSHLPQHVPGRMLVLAHREELLTQAKEKILWANPHLTVHIEQGTNVATTDADVVVASVPTLGRETSTRMEKFDPDHFSTVVVDEAHHAAAPTYRRILDYFEPTLQLGVTATPQRGDKTRLIDIFDEIVHFKTIQDGIEEGFLTNLAGYRIPTDVDISDVSTSNGDYQVGQLSEAVNVDARNRVAVESYKRLSEGKKAIAFCVDVAHAEDMAAAFNKAGIPTGVIHGKLSTEDREKVLEDFRSGRTPVLTNCMVLTEGFDEPSVECVILARPTKSQLLYTQIVGRGTRLFEGKERCLVIDLADATKGKKPMGLPTLMGLPADFDSEGEDLTEVVKKYKELEEKAPAEAARVKSVSDIKDAWETIDLFRPPPVNEELLEYTQLVWMETSNDKYVLNLSDGERLIIAGDTLGRYSVHCRHKGQLIELGVCETMDEAFRRSDKWVRNYREDQLNLLDADAQWRGASPSDKQLKWLKKFGVPITSDLTKGQASMMLDKLFAENPKPQKNRPAWLERKIEGQKRGY